MINPSCDANSHAETAAFRLQSFFRSPSKPPRPIASTDGTRIEEIIIWNTATYLSSYFTSGPGARYFRKKPDVAARETLPVQALALIRNRDAWDGVVDPIQLYNHVTKAMGALRYGLNGSAVEAMNNACDVVEILLIQQAPTLLSFLIQTLACQVRGNSKLEAHIRNFITDMAAKVLGSTHPLSIIVNSICKVSSVIDRCRVLRTVTDALVDSFKILEDPSPRAETRQCYLNGVTSLKLRKEAQDYLSLVFSPGWEGDDEQDAEQIYQTASLLQLRHNFVEAEIQYRKCLAWLKEVELDILANGEDSSWLGWRYLINDCLVKLVWGLERMERIEESKTMWWRSLEFAFAAYGQDSVYILVRAARFDDFLTRHGYVKESRTLRDWCPSLLYRTKLPPEHL